VDGDLITATYKVTLLFKTKVKLPVKAAATAVKPVAKKATVDEKATDGKTDSKEKEEAETKDKNNL